MIPMTKVQIPNKAVCILFYANALAKGFIHLLPTYGQIVGQTWFFSIG